ncbi:DUF2267 domain-containing protein [Pseudonocardia sp. KRD291]|uniref:DUF2267 domain-containing protein n=1 Tax=Pseudonocardia sp. KRD291 TaxID=2792007 RepID=UPI001C4A15EF|nr:DUF2267 domain-containing protein [Pseudonocardia sp. KRD291]MBW0101296.1 DUF2267 domain-containing protein [Pseudonocardia sp. KRD291]
MATYQEFVEGVRDRAGLQDAHEAREVSGSVLGALLRAAPAEERQRIVDALPGALGSEVTVPVGSGPASGPELLDELGRLVSRPPEQARYLLQAVLAQLREQDGALVDELAGHLPPETRDALSEAGDSPGRAVTTTPERPTELDGDDVAAGLRDLEGWSGDERGISRTVALPEDRIDPLVERVEREARRSDDHVRVSREAGAVTFTLRTRGEAVTRPDLELAGRIDTVVGGTG